MNMKNELAQAVDKVLSGFGIGKSAFKLEYPENPDHGDFSCNVAMVYAKQLSVAPKVLAEKIIVELKKEPGEGLNFVESISVAGPGFINFKIKDKVFAEQVMAVAQGGAEYGWGKSDVGKKVLIEYTDPNIFKVFHIGHLMSNAIGESLSRLIEGSGSSVVRLCYPSDIGLHIAKSVWAMKKRVAEIPAESAPIQTKTEFLGKMYVEGTQVYEVDPAVKSEIDALNKVLYEKSDPEINSLYNTGRKWSLDHFELLYVTLGTKFDGYIYESDMASVGLKIVRAHIGKVFQESEGAIIFKGENYGLPPSGDGSVRSAHGLHTRVFINSHGLPTYETKEMGLNITKFNKYSGTTESIVITANEQNDYFKVVLKTLLLIDENVGLKTKHIGHGMLRFASGKMSSRTGNVVSAESLIADIKALVTEKIANRELTSAEKEEIADMVAIGAIKYTILRQSIGGDVIFDSSASISFEGDSGPYLQYAAVRAGAVLEKGKGKIRSTEKEERSTNDGDKNLLVLPEEVTLLEKLISRFPYIVERARAEYAPQLVANYLITLAGAFNSYYANHQIIDDTDPLSPYRLELTQAFLTTMTNGLWLLGIKVPKRM